MSRKILDELKQQIPLLDYLKAQEWRPVRALRGGRWMGTRISATDVRRRSRIQGGGPQFGQ